MQKLIAIAAVAALSVSARGAETGKASDAVPVEEASWIGHDDFPAEALRNGWAGTVQIVWTIGADGRVTNCRVVKSSGHDLLDDVSCKLVTERGRYSPARDAAGKPVESQGKRRVAWILPGAPGPVLVQGISFPDRLILLTKLSFSIDENDKLRSCTVRVEGRFGSPEQPCPETGNRDRIDRLIHYFRGKGLKGRLELQDGLFVGLDRDLRAQKASDPSSWAENLESFATVDLAKDGKPSSCKFDDDRPNSDVAAPLCMMGTTISGPVSLVGTDGKPVQPSGIYLGSWTRARSQGQ